MNFRNSKNNLSRYTNGLVFTKAGEYGEFFYLRELVCNLWQVMSSEDIRQKIYVIKLDFPRIDNKKSCNSYLLQ